MVNRPTKGPQVKSQVKSTDDSRFVTLNSDPRFRQPKKKSQKVVIDERFKDVLQSNGEGGSSKGRKEPKVDRYGRKIGKDKRTRPDRFYELEGGASRDGDDLQKLIRGDILLESSDEGEDGEESSSDENEDREPVHLGPAKERLKAAKLPKKKGVDSSLIPGEEDLDEEALAEAEAQANAALNADQTDEQSERIIQEGEETKRFAVVNLDWDHIRALDLYKLFSSFLPRTQKQALLSVKVFPSEFGKEQMKREEREGPPVEIFKELPDGTQLERAKRAMRGAEAALLEDDSNEGSDEMDEEVVEGASDVDDDDDVSDLDPKTFIQQLANEGEEFNEEALREYQLNRLRYYYAIVEMEDPSAAKVVFDTCNGHEFERSANVLDLRYVPDDMTFDDEPRDEANAQSSLQGRYEPHEFVTSALRHSKVKLTWDDDDPDRVRTTRHQISNEDLDKMDFDEYLASSGSDDEEDGPDRSKDKLRARYRALLDEINEGTENGDNDVFDNKSNRKAKRDIMEITFQPALEEAARKAQNKDSPNDESTIEKYKRKEKERRDRKKANRAGLEEQADLGESRVRKESTGFEDPFFEETPDFDDDADLTKSVGKDGHKQKTEPKVRETKEERNARKKAKEHLASLIEDTDGAGQNHFNMKEILKAEKLSKKGKKVKGKANLVEDDFEMDISDPRFQAVKDSHHFAIDPNNPHFKKTKNMQKLLNSRGNGLEADTAANHASQATDTGSNAGGVKSLIHSIKSRAEAEKSKHKPSFGKRKR